MGETPAWGTPEDDDGGGRAAAPSWGTPAAASGPALLGVAEFVMREWSGFMSNGGYELLTREGAVLGSVEQQPSVGGWFFGSMAGASYRLLDASGAPIATIDRPGSLGRMTFVVSTAGGHEVGTLEQENAFMAPRLQLRASDGWTARLTGGGFGSGGVRTLTEGVGDSPADRLVGEVSQQSGGLGAFFAGTDTYLVRLSDDLTGARRLLAVVATACIDLILNAKKKSSGNQSPFGL